MGIFDIFKKRKKGDDQHLKSDLNEERVRSSTEPPLSINDSYSKNAEKPIYSGNVIDEDASVELFNFIFKYREYVVSYLSMMFQGNNSPIAAYEKVDGDIIGYLFVAEDMSYNLSVEQVIDKMEVEFERRINDNIISSWVIFYHSEFNNDDNYKAADGYSKTRAITAKYRLGDELNYISIPYTLTGDEVEYRGFSVFSQQQNAQILSAQLTAGKDYFQEKVEIKPEIHENEVGIKIKKVNNGFLGNMWSGIFGFERLNTSNQIPLEFMALVFARGIKRTVENIIISEINYKDVVFRGVKIADDSMTTIYPVIKSVFCIDVINTQINEWENSDNLEAVISGGGRDTFGITYFATDYAENKSIYHSSPKLDITFSAILFVLKDRDDEEGTILPNEASFAEDFVAYMPHKDLAEFGCYDFLGIIEDFYENDISEGINIEGYILNIRLINYEDKKDFFTIPMFLNKDNMKLNNLEKGMRVSGAFQLLGEIKKIK